MVTVKLIIKHLNDNFFIYGISTMCLGAWIAGTVGTVIMGIMCVWALYHIGNNILQRLDESIKEMDLSAQLYSKKLREIKLKKMVDNEKWLV